MKNGYKPNRLLEVLAPPSDSDSLHPEAEPLFRRSTLRLDLLARLHGQSILKAADLTREEVIELCKLAAILESVEIVEARPLDGKICITAFFEASTRTRTSFESAVLRLDGKIISIPDGRVTGTTKGESLEDIGEMFNAYGDLVIMRHTETDAPERLLKNLRVPLINAGNGTGEHPTQALADWYALLKWKPELARPESGEKIQLGILGTPGSMRAVKSFVLMMRNFAPHIEQVTVVLEMADPFGEVAADLDAAGISCRITNDLHEVLPDLDVIYMNSIVAVGDSYKNLETRFKLDANSKLKPGAVILHPLARLDELDPGLDSTPHNLYWSQAHGAVFIRQALLVCVFNRLDKILALIPDLNVVRSTAGEES